MVFRSKENQFSMIDITTLNLNKTKAQRFADRASGKKVLTSCHFFSFLSSPRKLVVKMIGSLLLAFQFLCSYIDTSCVFL